MAKNKADRYAELKKMLEQRRREITAEIHGHTIEKSGDVQDAGDSAEADIQEDIELALLEMRSETLSKIEVALGQLHDGRYGTCSDCGGEISQARLRALPFAVRCKECQEDKETAEARKRARMTLLLPGTLFDKEEKEKDA